MTLWQTRPLTADWIITNSALQTRQAGTFEVGQLLFGQQSAGCFERTTG
jgi:hypothetical protein